MPNGIARALSILGHTLLTLPATTLLLVLQRKSGAWHWSALAVMGAIAAGVMAYSRWQVRRNHWRHVDASGGEERRTLNRFLLILLAVAALAAWAWSPQREFALGLALSALPVAAALLLARACKLSLHVAFAIYAAVLLAPLSWLACAAGVGFALAVAWSRLALGRHAPRDLVAGGVAGLLAGLAFWRLLPSVAG